MQDHDGLALTSGLRVPCDSCALAVMAKAPRVGTVKTRLVPPLTPDEATSLSACFLRDVASVVAQLRGNERVDGYAAYTPTGSEAAFDGLLPAGFRLLAQRGAHLGERLFHAAEDLFAAGYEAACLINSDSPTLPVSVLRDAVTALRKPGDRVVLGPAEDGGYYLIGLKLAHQRLFEDITWSTQRVLAQTLQRAADIALSVELLPVWYDVDDAASLLRLCAELFASGASDGRAGGRTKGYEAPHTRQYLRQLMGADGSDRFGLALAAGSRGW